MAANGPGQPFRREKTRDDLRQKLKSRFESIFEKYGRDFSGIGDEVDLETGNVIVNNGHLQRMANETDAEGKLNTIQDVWESESCEENSADLDVVDEGSEPESQDGDETDVDLEVIQQRAATLNRPREATLSPVDPKWAFPKLPGDDEEVEYQDEWESEDNMSEQGNLPRTSIWDPEPEPLSGEDDSIVKLGWTAAEDALLKHLRTNTTLTYQDLVPYFPGRSKTSITIRWSRTQLGLSNAALEDKDRRRLVIERNSEMITGNDVREVEEKETRRRAAAIDASRRWRKLTYSLLQHITKILLGEKKKAELGLGSQPRSGSLEHGTEPAKVPSTMDDATIALTGKAPALNGRNGQKSAGQFNTSRDTRTVAIPESDTAQTGDLNHTKDPGERHPYGSWSHIRDSEARRRASVKAAVKRYRKFTGSLRLHNC